MTACVLFSAVTETELFNGKRCEPIRNALKRKVPLIAFPLFPQTSVFVDSDNIVNPTPVSGKANHDREFPIV